MKILIIHHRIPYPLNSGMDKVRYNLIRSLSVEHQVTLIVPVDEYTEQNAVEHVRSQCYELVTVPVKNRINIIQKSKILSFYRWFRLILFRIPMYITNFEYSEIFEVLHQVCEAQQYDLVQAASHVTSNYLKYALNIRPHVLGPMDDMIEAARTDMLVSSTPKSKLYFFLEYYARKHYDVKACLNSDWVFFHSQEDLKRFSSYVNGMPGSCILPVAVEPEDERGFNLESAVKSQEPNSIVFVGGLGSMFNVDAVYYFYRQIFPLVLKRISNAKFYIVGQHPPQDIKSLENDRQVTVTGSVPDVRPYIEKASVYIAPIRTGTGFKTKIVEAMCLGKAIISTKAGLQGLWDIGHDVFRVAENPEDFAKQIIILLNDKELRLKLGAKARALYVKSYSFDAVAPKTLEIYREIEQTLIRRNN